MEKFILIALCAVILLISVVNSLILHINLREFNKNSWKIKELAKENNSTLYKIKTILEQKKD